MPSLSAPPGSRPPHATLRRVWPRQAAGIQMQVLRVLALVRPAAAAEHRDFLSDVEAEVVSQGMIAHLSEEHLVTSDSGIVMPRRQLQHQLHALRMGRAMPATRCPWLKIGSRRTG